MGEMVLQALREVGTNFLQSAAVFVPRAIITLIILLAGWVIATVLKRLTRGVLSRVGFGTLCERQGVSAMLRKADLPGPEAIAGTIVFWLVFVAFLLSGIDMLRFAALQGLVSEFALFVPRLVVALVILVVGIGLANVAWRATLLAAVNSQVPSPRVLSGTVRALGLILTVAMALDQLAVARTIVLTAFAIAFGAVMLGLAIAFGIGGGSVARRIVERWFPESEAPADDRVGHL